MYLHLTRLWLLSGCIAALLLPLLLLLSAAVRAVEPWATQSRIEWMSDNQSRAEIPNALAALYATLFNTGQLDVVAIKDPGTTVDLTCRAEGIIVGPHFPVAMDSLLCDLNPHVCSRELVPVDEATLDQVDQHLGGFHFSQGDWRNYAGSVLFLPRVKLTEYERLGIGYKNSGETIDGMLRAREVTCEEFGGDCEETVRILNGAKTVFDPEYEGPVVLPTRGVNVSIELKQPGDWLTEQAERAPEQTSDAYREQVRKWGDPRIKAMESLKSKTISVGPGRFESLTDEPHFAKQRELFELINHPGIDAGWQPPAIWPAGKIAIMDSRVDANHCDLGPNIKVISAGSASAAGATTTAVPCGTLDPFANDIEHHGTHVTALLGGSINNQGIGGLIPQVDIVTVEMDPERLKESSYRGQLSFGPAGLAGMVISRKAKTINLSWTYSNDTRSGVDDIKAAIEAFQWSAVVVMAAGNQGSSFGDGACNVFPACYHDFVNVLTVVGIDRNEDNPSLWPQSNNSPEFHIAAIATNVLSATSDNKHGELSGTSQAAPQVSATAAYLWATASAAFNPHEVTPRRIRDRIIYTADFFPQLKDQVLGGRLNMTRALGITQATLTRKTDAGDNETIKGEFIQILERDSNTVRLTHIELDAGRFVPFVRVKRLLKNPAGNGYVAFISNESGMERYIGPVATKNARMEIETASGPTYIVFRDIVDFTAAF